MKISQQRKKSISKDWLTHGPEYLLIHVGHLDSVVSHASWPEREYSVANIWQAEFFMCEIGRDGPIDFRRSYANFFRFFGQIRTHKIMY